MGSPRAIVLDSIFFGEWLLAGTILEGCVLTSFMCRIAGHRVDRRRVWNDGIDFRTACGRCGVPMLRDITGWREFDEERDANPEREERHHG